MCPVHITLSYPSAAVLCHCVKPIWLLKGLCRNKLGVKREWLGSGIAEHCIPCLEGYTSPFTSLEEIIVSIFCFCPYFVSLVEIQKATPTHQQILQWIAHLIYAIPHFLFLHPSHSSGAQGSNCRGNPGHMQWGMRRRATGKQKKEKSWRIIIFKPTAWNLCPRQAFKIEIYFATFCVISWGQTWFSCFELVSLKSFRSSLTSPQEKNSD